MSCVSCGDETIEAVRVTFARVREDMQRRVVYTEQIDNEEPAVFCPQCILVYVGAAEQDVVVENLVEREGMPEEEALDFVSYNDVGPSDEVVDELLSDNPTHEPAACAICGEPLLINERVGVVNRGKLYYDDFHIEAPLSHHSPDRHVCGRCVEHFDV